MIVGAFILASVHTAFRRTCTEGESRIAVCKAPTAATPRSTSVAMARSSTAGRASPSNAPISVVDALDQAIFIPQGSSGRTPSLRRTR